MSERGSTEVQSSASDRVTELYRGEIWDRKNQQVCRDRIHWMCSRVTGQRLLDVGCSQGIATLLLGQEGHKVVGVDIDPAAIEFAQRELAAYPDFVKENVEFRLVGAHELPFEDGSFDSVLLGEIIEHLNRPELMLAEIRRLLKPGGTVVITTPFGVHPDPRHVRTFYLSGFLRVVEEFFHTRQLQIVGKYICYAGVAEDRSAEDVDGSAPAADRLQLSEEAFRSAELAYLEQLEARHNRSNALEKQVTALKSDARARQSEISELSRKAAAAERWRGASVEFVKHLQSLLAGAGTDVDLSRLVERAERISSRINANPDAAQEIEALGEVARDVLGAFDARLRTQEREFANLSEAHRAEIDRQREESERRLSSERRRVDEGQQEQADKLREALNARNEADQKIKHLQSRLDRQGEVIKYLTAASEFKFQEVRYQLGDAFVEAATSLRGFLALPFRFVGLFFRGLRRRRERRRLEREVRRKYAPHASAAAVSASTPTAAETGSGMSSTRAATAKATPAKTPATTAAAPTIQFTPVEAPDRAPKARVKMAAIMDEFTYECFKPECNLLAVTPDNWEKQLHASRPDLLFVESAWQGNGGVWRYQVARPRRIDGGPLLALVNWCKSQNIPTAFWNKEDPPNFEQFIHAAALFDHVFTTDQNCIPVYRARLGHDRVYALPFAAQGAIHNPIGARKRLVGNVCFAGAYYAKRHTDRQGDMDLLLKPALKRGLHIYDRMHDVGDERYRFPDEYAQAIQGSLSYPEMLDAYKRYRVFLNVNSVTDSPTMFSRRVLELLACGTPVISTYALGIEKLLGRDCVPLVETEEEAAQWLDMLLKNDEIADRMVLQAQRRIFHEHTYEHRLQTLLETIGIPVDRPRRRVSIITCTNRPDKLENIIDNYERQSYSEKEFLLILNSDAYDLDEVKRRLETVPNARAFQLPEERTLGECLNKATEEAAYEYWSKFDDDNFYAENFITDLMMPFSYTDASVIGKYSYYAHMGGARCLALRYPGCEHQYVTLLSGSALIVDRKVSDEIRFPDRNRGEDTQFLRECVAQGFKLYSADRFNYVVRRSKSVEDHTWKISEGEFLRHCQIVAYTDDYAAHVEV